MGNRKPYASPGGAPFCAALALAAVMLASAAGPARDAAAQGAHNPAGVVINREHDGPYKGGRTASVTVFIAAAQWDGMTAMGLYERVPSGWALVDLQTIAGPAPAVTPEPGSGGVLQFIWITPPRAPLALRYTLQVPPRDAGPKPFSGQVEYRLDAGKLVSGVALSQADGVADAPPVIQLRGSAEMTVAAGGEFVDPGATATDAEDGDISARVERTGQVDTDTPGAYTLVYNVADSVGNQAEPVERAVRVTPEAPSGSGSDAGGTAPPGPGAPGSSGARPAGSRPPLPEPPPDSPGYSGPLPDIVIPEDAGDYTLPRQEGSAETRPANAAETPGVAGPPTGASGGAWRAGDASASTVAGANADGRAGDAREGTRAIPVILAAAVAFGVVVLVVAGCWTARAASRRSRTRS